MENNFRLLQPRDFGQVITDAFNFVKIYLKAMGLPILILVIPVVTVCTIFFTDSTTALFRSLATGQNPFLNTSWAREGSRYTLFYSLGLLLSSTFLSLTIIECFIRSEAVEGGELTSKDIFNGIKSDFWRLIGFYIAIILVFSVCICVLVALIILLFQGGGLGRGLGVIFLIAVWFAAFYSVIALCFSAFIFIRERVGILQSISRSFFLIKGSWWQTFAILLVMYLLVIVASYAFRLPAILAIKLQWYHSSDDISLIKYNPVYMVFNVIGAVGSSLLGAFVHVAVILQYYSLLERKEGVEVMREIEDIGTPEAPQV